MGNFVKQLLVLISILLLSSSVIGDNHKGETLFQRGQYPDYKWMEFGDIDSQPKYKGQVKDGKPNGVGVLINIDGSKYVGEWKNGERNGFGKFTDYMERTFEGEYKDNRVWNGITYDKNGKFMNRIVNGEKIDQ